MSVGRKFESGHVYNLETCRGVYIAGGILVHNCRSLDGELFLIAQGPIPPLHWGCRSSRLPTINGERVGERVATPLTRKQLLREFAEIEGLEVPTGRASIPRGFKAKYDEYAGKRLREMMGVLPRKVTFPTWLREQGKAFQDSYLGPTRAKLFRAGGLDLKKFVDFFGNEIPLRDLARMHAEAFRAAGLDPTRFLRPAA